MTAKDLFDLQEKLRDAKADLAITQEQIYRHCQSGKGGVLADPHHAMEHSPSILEKKAVITTLEAQVTVAQEELGGKVFRIPTENMPLFEKKLRKVNRKADKLGCALSTAKVAETEEEERTVNPNTLEKALFSYSLVVLDGTVPHIAGYRFLAAIDHTVAKQAGDPVIVKQAPETGDVDLSPWWNADAKCEHCNRVRSRNTTYLVQNLATKEIKKVGGNCLADFIGGYSPERMASYLEYRVEFEQSLGGEEMQSSSGRQAREVKQYLAHVAACIRHRGWSARSSSSFATASQAWDNILYYGKFDEKRHEPMFVEVTAEDHETAEKAIAWAQGLDPQGDFEHNLHTMANLKYMPKKGDGIVAYIVQGYVKDETKKQEREAEEKLQETAEKAPEGRCDIVGVIISVYTREDPRFGAQRKMTVMDDRGFKVNGAVPSSLRGSSDFYNRAKPAKEGDRVSFSAELQPKHGDDFFAYFKRPTKAKIVESQNA